MDLQTAKVANIYTKAIERIKHTEASSLLGAIFLGILGEFPGGNTLSSIISWCKDKKKAEQLDKRLHDLNEELYAFKTEIENKVNKISGSRLTMPDVHLFGLALETGKYYYKLRDMRELFSTLISKLFDVEMYKAIHPSYIEIIKQLSPLDAKLLTEFRPRTDIYSPITSYDAPIQRATRGEDGLWRDINDNILHVDENGNPQFSPADITNISIEIGQPVGHNYPEVIMPVVSYYFAKGNERRLIQNNIIPTNISNDDALVSSSITNLERLGLIKINYGTGKLKNENAYDFSLKRPSYLRWAEFNTSNNALMSGMRGHAIMPGQYDRIDVEKGIAQLTQFGYNFITVCVLEEEYEIYALCAKISNQSHAEDSNGYKSTASNVTNVDTA